MQDFNINNIKDKFLEIIDKIKGFIFANDKTKKIFFSCLLAFLIVLQITFFGFLVRAVSPSEKQKDENVVMKYSLSGNMDYKVYLKPNDFIKQDYLGPDEAYVLDLIDYVQISSLSNFSSNAKTKVNGNNKLVATLKVYYKETSDTNSNPEILNKEKILSEKTLSFDDSRYSVLNSYNLYLSEYLDMLKEFQNQIKIAMDGYLEISSTSNFEGKVGGIPYKDNYTTVLKIPLSSSVIRIENEKTDEKVSRIYEGDLAKNNKLVMSYIVIANLVIFGIICYLIKKIFVFKKKTEYEKEINKLLRNYDDIIVNTSTSIDIEKYKIIEIEEFKEILNLSRELLLPIMNYEILKGKETWFYVIKDEILYRYIISESLLNERKYEKHKKF